MKSDSDKIILLVAIYLLIFFAPMFFPTVDENESTGVNDYARITDVEYKAELVDTIPGESKVIITERLTFDIHAADEDNLYWELWRALPEDYVDGLKVYYKVNYVNEILDNGSVKVYEESPKLYWYDSDYTDYPYGPGKWYHSEGPYDEYNRRYECVLFYVNGIYRDEVTFEIQYEMFNPALKYSDVSQLDLIMYSEETIKYLDSFKAEILIPNKDMPKKGNYKVQTFGTNSHTFDFYESDVRNPGYHTFYFNLDEEDLKFKSYNQFIEFYMLTYNEDKHSITDFAPNNNYSHTEYLEEALFELEEYENIPIETNKKKIQILLGSIVFAIIMLIYMANRDKSIRKKNKFFSPTKSIIYYRDIPSDLDPYVAAQIVFSKSKKQPDSGDGYSAILLNLVRKGYIELQRIDPNGKWEFQNILIKVLYTNNTNKNVSGYNTSVHNGNKNTVVNHTINNLVRPVVPTMAGDIDNYHRRDKIDVNTLPNSITNPVVGSPVPIVVNPTPVDANSEIFNINGKKLEKLSINEQAYLKMINRHALNGTITMNYFQARVSHDYDNTDSFVTTVENSTLAIGVKEGYFQLAHYDKIKESTLATSSTQFLFGMIILILGNLIMYNTRLGLAYGSLFIIGIMLIISSMYLKKVANKYILFSQFGEDEYAKWKGLYDFLNSETLMNERTVIDLPLWEKYLVYATAFGISEKVTKAIQICCPDVTTSPVLNNTYYRSSSFRSSSRSFRNSARSASYTSRSMRSSGGGYYGGGRGGGGGGGGH